MGGDQVQCRGQGGDSGDGDSGDNQVQPTMNGITQSGVALVADADGTVIVDGVLQVFQVRAHCRREVEDLGSSPHITTRKKYGNPTNMNGDKNGEPRKRHGGPRNGG
jgi:hypothetical protein